MYQYHSVDQVFLLRYQAPLGLIYFICRVKTIRINMLLNGKSPQYRSLHTSFLQRTKPVLFFFSLCINLSALNHNTRSIYNFKRQRKWLVCRDKAVQVPALLRDRVLQIMVSIVCVTWVSSLHDRYSLNPHRGGEHL